MPPFLPSEPALQLDGSADQRSPLGPTPVVVADVGIAEEFGQDEPGVGAALTNPAVGDRRLASDNALAAIELAQLVGGLEGAILGDRTRPRHVCGTGNVAT